jgi:LysR family transcriptional activator of dmlA
MDILSDLAFFALVVRRGSLAAAAQEIGITPPAVSKRLAGLEERLRVRLLNRTTRRMSLTPEGEMYLAEGERITADLDSLERKLAGGSVVPQGLLRINATLGFGRRHITPQLSRFALLYPEVEVQLHLSERPANLVEQAFDIGIRFGEQPDARITARKLADNRRFLCASPAYIKQRGVPATPRDLHDHNCIVLRESDETYGSWHFRSGTRQETVKVRGPLSTNDGDGAVAWALDGHGVVLRSEWDVAPYLRSGRLCRILEEWSAPPADIYLLFATKAHLQARTRAMVNFMLEAFAEHRSDVKMARPDDELFW